MSSAGKAGSLTLIGMPGSGKSTLSALLAGQLNRRLVDTDRLIEEAAGMSLQVFRDSQGTLALRQLEEQVVLDADLSQAVIATGGSVVYSRAAMQRLAAGSYIVFLHISCATMLARLGDPSERGLAVFPGSSLEDMYRERLELYRQYANRQLDAEKTPDSLLQELLALAGKCF